MNILKSQLTKQKSLLGLSFEGRQMTLVEVCQSANDYEVKQSHKIALALDLLNTDSVLVGNEIRNHLESMDISVKRCVIAVPLKWALHLNVEIPSGLEEEDIKSFIRLRAEREFPFSLDDLVLSESRYKFSDGTSGATVVAIPANHIQTLLQVMKAAGLRPVGITFGITSLLDEQPSNSSIIHIHNGGVDLAIAAPGGISTLRVLCDETNSDQDGPVYDIQGIIREIRITLGQLSDPAREFFKKIKVIGPSKNTESIAAQIKSTFDGMGISVDDNSLDNANVLPVTRTTAIRCLRQRPLSFNFLPPKVSPLKQLIDLTSTRRTLWLAGIPAVLLFLTIFTVFVQSQYLKSLERKWSRIESEVGHLEVLQDRIRTFRPWYDDSIQSLSIIKSLTSALPEDGAVWIRTLEIEDLSKVTCTGDARSNNDWLKMREKLGKISGVSDVQTIQVRGNAPLQFTISYRWDEGASDGI